jgi:cytoskeletal protein CcmA (bactofilin family)
VHEPDVWVARKYWLEADRIASLKQQNAGPPPSLGDKIQIKAAAIERGKLTVALVCSSQSHRGTIMFGRNAKSSEIDSLIGISARIEGDLVFTGGLRIDGEVHGNVIASQGGDSLLIVSEHARIEGEVRCANLVVNGYIAGTVYSTELLELQPKGRIHGDVHYRLLEMHGGALVTGKLTHEATPVSASEPVFHLGAAEAGASA